jgi:hypothetical protein
VAGRETVFDGPRDGSVNGITVDNKKWDTATAVLLAAFAILIVATFRSYGITVDEPHSHANGNYFLDWYASGFNNRAIVTEGNQRLYGSFFNSISAFVSNHSPFGLYETGHLMIAISSLIGVFFAYKLGKYLAGSMAGFFAALFLLLTPVYYGHSFMNPKDIPFATMFLISVYCLTIAYDRLPRLGVKWIVTVGGVIGLTLGIRVGAVMLFGYLAVLVVLKIIAVHRTDASFRGEAVMGFVTSAVVSSVGVGIVAWLVMLVWWPYAQISPILNPLRGMRSSANFTDYSANALYRGRFIPADALPRSYLPTWFSITLPEFYGLILGLALMVLIGRKLIRKEIAHGNPDLQSKIIFLIFAAVFPIASALILRPILYDGNRHFLFVVPPLAVLTGVALAWLFVEGLPRQMTRPLGWVVVILCAMTAYDMVRLHPYEYAFFNRTYGGLRAALGHYETDYWGVSHKEGVDWLIRNYRPDAPPHSIRVANTAADYQTGYYLQGDRPETRRFVPVDKKDHPNVILSITRFDVHLKYPGKVLHVVERMGTPLLYVVEVAPPSG